MTASPSSRCAKQDPLKFETLHTKLRAFCVSAREMARRISASPGVREVGEMVVAIYTPEGDAIALVQRHHGACPHDEPLHQMDDPRRLRGQSRHPRRRHLRQQRRLHRHRAGAGRHGCRCRSITRATLVGWAGAVCHELEAGGITPGGDVCLAQERFTEGLFVCAEKIGENDEIRRDYVIRCERNLRMPIYWVLDEKAKVASCIDMRESVKATDRRDRPRLLEAGHRRSSSRRAAAASWRARGS